MRLHLIYYVIDGNNLWGSFKLYDDASDELLALTENESLDVFKQKGAVT